jgi:UDP-N-acetylglucosamine--N-acetylmuramyl-(pentapeptide) pyrophosphoryl-undecaprenol N-acetylglucosamine transferase
MASVMGVPVYLQEQNSYPGITNKLLKERARKICVAYEGMDRFFPKEKIVLTGNPIRQDILVSIYTKENALKHFSLVSNKKTVLVVGGSLGARTVNEAIEANLWSIEKAGVQVLWQTGKNFSGEFGSFSWGTRTAFIKRMDLAYKVADVVISRAGAMSVSELSALGKATIFVPSPFVAEDHQTKNANSLVDKQAALLCKDVESSEKLGKMLIALLQDENEIDKLKGSIAKLGLPLAAESIVNEIIKDLGA